MSARVLRARGCAYVKGTRLFDGGPRITTRVVNEAQIADGFLTPGSGTGRNAFLWTPLRFPVNPRNLR